MIFSPKSFSASYTQSTRRVPSLNALNESFSMNDRPSTWMLLHLAPNSTFFTSLPRTIGRTYGLLTLTIRLGMLSLALPLSWCLRYWRYIFVIVSISASCLSEKIPAQGFSLPSLLNSLRIFPNRSNTRRITLNKKIYTYTTNFSHGYLQLCLKNTYICTRTIMSQLNISPRRVLVEDIMRQLTPCGAW